MAEVFPKRMAIVESQVERVRALLGAILPANYFYAQKFEAAGVNRRISNLGQFSEWIPFTTKQELVDDQRSCPAYGTNLTFPLERYTRCHQTSGTSGGAPLRWLDTPESWEWMLDCWVQVHRVAGVRRS